MKGDFSRSTFRKKKHYRKVNMQQGRVQLDSDWNEQTDIHTYYERIALQDVIGDSGTLNESTGFSISSNALPLFSWDNVPGNESDILKEFLKQNFGTRWIEILQFVKSTDGNTISISNGSHSLSITLNDAKTRAVLIIDSKSAYEFTVKTEDSKLSIHPKLYTIGAGHYYVDGILCENETEIDAFRQLDLPLLFDQNQYLFSWDNVPGSDSEKLKEFLKQNFGVETSQFVKSTDGNTISISEGPHSLSIVLNDTKTKATLIINSGNVYEFIAKTENNKLNIYYKFNPILPKEAGTCLAYLEVWEQHLTALDDPEMSEPALGGADTTTRTKIVWQVKLLQLGDERNYSCLSSIASWDDLVKPSTGTLQARSKPQKNTDNPCILPPGAGYRGLENQLYRVEIHDPGEPAKGATFKWSRDNGAVVTRIKDISGAELTVADIGRDKLLGFAPGQWVEVIDNRHELWGIPGTLAKLADVKGNTLTFDISSVKGDPLNNENYPQEFNPKARKWDSPGSIAVTTPAENDGYIELEDGVEVKFTEGNYKTNGYWLIPARTAKGDVEWPRIGNAPEALYPKGIKHHFCRLALLEYDNNGFVNLISDCRKFFPATTALNGLSANTGIVSLNLRQGHDLLFGPFEHWLENLSTPPAIILGLSQDISNEIYFDEVSQTFKAVSVNIRTFKVQAPPPPERELNLKLRWWAIPGQERGVQVGKPVPSITFDPPTIRIGDSAIIRVIDPTANKDPLNRETVEISVTASIRAQPTDEQPGGTAESRSVRVNATETGPNTGIFEVQIQISNEDDPIHPRTVKVGDQTMVFDGTFDLHGGFVEATYWYSVDGTQKTATDVADIPKAGTGSITGKVTDDKGKEIVNAEVMNIHPSISISSLTDSAGNYRLDNIPPGDQDVVASASGFNSDTKRVTVIPDQIITVNFMLTPLTGTITGKVTNAETNATIQGATVSIEGTSISATTDDSGNYTLPNVPIGVQTVRASKARFNPGITTVEVISNQTVTANFQLRPIEICPGQQILRPCPGPRPGIIGPGPCPGPRPRVIGPINEPVPPSRPGPSTIELGTERRTACSAGRPTIAPKSGKKPQVKPRGAE